MILYIEHFGRKKISGNKESNNNQNVMNTKSEYDKEYYLKNKEKKKEREKKRYLNNKEKIKQRCKDYYLNNKENAIKRVNEYYINNKDEILEYKKEYRQKNDEKIKEYRLTHKEYFDEYNKTYKKNRCVNDKLFKLKENIKSLIRQSFKRRGYSKKSKTCEILGCGFNEFKNYIELKFEPWMNWNNYGNWNGEPNEINVAWDIDHIIPLSSATTEEEIIGLNHYTNLQPLCSYTNRHIKKNNYNLEK